MPIGRFTLLDVLLVVCAIATTGVVVSRGLQSSPAASRDELVGFDGWKEDLEFDRRIGSSDAPLRLLIWTDYQCPACKRLEVEVARLRQSLGDSLAIVYRHYPLAIHPQAFNAALAADCAHRQGRFEQMHLALFARSLPDTELPLDSLAAESGIQDVRSFKACLAEPLSAERVSTDLSRAKSLRLGGTPVLQVGDRLSVGGRPAEEIATMLRSAIR